MKPLSITDKGGNFGRIYWENSDQNELTPRPPLCFQSEQDMSLYCYMSPKLKKIEILRSDDNGNSWVSFYWNRTWWGGKWDRNPFQNMPTDMCRHIQSISAYFRSM